MTFTLNRRSTRLLNKLSKTYLDNSGGIERYDNNSFKLELANPNKAVKWFQQVDIPTTPVFIDGTNPQLIADAFNQNIPGLAGGPLDVYVSLGDYYAFA